MKPQNLILDAGGHVHLIDFETAREYDGTKKKDTVFFGTEGSAAPEQYGYAQTDMRTDVFGIGKIAEYLYEEYQVGYDPLTEKRMQRIIKKATAFDPADRYQNVQALLLAIRNVRRQTERGENKWLKAVVAIESIVLLLVLAGVLFFWTGFQKTKNMEEEDYAAAIAERQIKQQDESAEDLSAQADSEEIVTLEGDPLLLQAIRETAGSNEVTKRMLSGITRIAVIGDQIYTEETPVEDLENIVYQDGFNDGMVNGGITDLSVLTNLPNLKEVFLCNQKISDISPLQELPIEGLYVCGNQIKDFSPVEKMQELSTLYLVDNPVGKMPQLSGCTKLTRLALCGNDYETLDFLQGSNAALPFHPVEYQTHEVNAVGRGCVVKRIIFCVNIITQHGRCEIHGVAQQILSHDNNRYACGAEVFLCPCIQKTEFCNINLLRENGRGHIAHQRHIACIGKLRPACTVNGVVQCDIKIIRFGVEFGRIQCGDVVEG